MSASGIGQFIPLILIFVIFYFFLIRPQQKKVKEHKIMVEGLKRGDKIITSGGIIGSINKINDNKEIMLQISEDTEIKLAAGMITDLYSVSEKPKEKTSDKNETDQNKKSFFSNLIGKKNK